MTNPNAKEDVMICYCLATFSASALFFGMRRLLLMDSTHNRLSKAADYVQPVEIIAWVFAWYGISVTMVIANSWLFHSWQGVGFPFPVLTTMVHMWFKVLLSRSAFMWKREKPPHLNFFVNLWMIIPVGIATAGDILMSNMSLKYVTATFYTIVKSGSLMWILLWAAVFKIEALTATTLSVVACICTGMFLASWGDMQFSLAGMLLILGATCLSGVRWALLQLLQSLEPTCSDPLLVIYYIAPSSALALTPLSLVDLLDENLKSSVLDAKAITEVVVVILVVGIFSFALIFAEIKLISITSSLTMGVFGTVKEIIQIAMAGLVFHDKITILNLVGLGMAMAGTLTYNIARNNPMRLSVAREDGKAGHTQQVPKASGGGTKGSGSVKASGGGQQYSAVSQQEVDEELRVFKYNNAESWEMEIEGELEELEEFSSLDVVR